jgi:hypothetical protein
MNADQTFERDCWEAGVIRRRYACDLAHSIYVPRPPVIPVKVLHAYECQACHEMFSDAPGLGRSFCDSCREQRKLRQSRTFKRQHYVKTGRRKPTLNFGLQRAVTPD